MVPKPCQGFLYGSRHLDERLGFEMRFLWNEERHDKGSAASEGSVEVEVAIIPPFHVGTDTVVVVAWAQVEASHDECKGEKGSTNERASGRTGQGTGCIEKEEEEE